MRCDACAARPASRRSSSWPACASGRRFVRLAGCDVFTAPCEVLGEFLRSDRRAPGGAHEPARDLLRGPPGHRGRRHPGRRAGANRSTVASRAGVRRVSHGLPSERRVPRARERRAAPAAVRRARASATSSDAPGVHEWQILRKSKLLDLAAPPAGHLAADTHMSLLADGDFVNQQEAIDAALLERVAKGPTQ